MKKTILTLMVGACFGLGLLVTSEAQASELPEANLGEQLKAEITQQAAQGIADGQNLTSPTPTPTPTLSPVIINTGGNTTVDTSTNQSNTTSVANSNQADVNQGVVATANTGDNTANYNISIGGDAGRIHTGDASVYSQLETAANTNQSGVHNTCPTPNGGGQVVNTGDNLTVAGGSNTNCTTTVTNGNGAVITQVANGSANTGGNEAIGNISIGGSAGQITTGKAMVGSMLVSRANSNVVLIGGSGANGGPGDGANIYIVNTGTNATISDRRNSSNSTNVTNTNQAKLTQQAMLVANTGGNQSNGNINLNGDAGVIRTGDAVVATSLEVAANSNQTAVATPAAQAANSTETDVTNSGSDATVDTSSESHTSTEVTNTNTADVDQVVIVMANTGNNTANGNIAFNGNAGVIETGDAIITTSMEVDVNKNMTAIMGSTSDASTSTLDVVNTGDDVTVDASNETHNSTEVNNTNTADVDQTVVSTANTGNNTANGNIGQTSISTGDVTITTEIITNANNNYTFIVDSNVTGLELFQQFVAAFLGMSWEELVGGMGNTALPGTDNTSVVNSGNNVTVLNEQTHNRQVVVNNTNTATVNQTVTASANTGGNSCVGNIGNCSITTGDATIWTRLIANLNNNFTFIGTVQLPEVPVTPEPETPTTPEVPAEQEPEVLGESVERVVLAAALPNTGGTSYALFGLGLVLLGAGLTLGGRKAYASR